jgi:hypothetical protein
MNAPRGARTRHAAGLAGALAVVLAGVLATPAGAQVRRWSALEWPEGSTTIPFDNLEGIILLLAKLHGEGGRDTAGTLVFDTGAGYLSVDLPVARWLGVADSARDYAAVDYADHPLPRLELGTLQLDQLSPLLTLDASVIRRVTDRDVLGLVGQGVFASYGVLIDYREQRLALVPVDEQAARAARASAAAAGAEEPLRAAAIVAEGSRRGVPALLSPRAVPVRFDLGGDNKMFVRVRVSNPRPPEWSEWLTLVLDTGATKCVLFEDGLYDAAPQSVLWPSVHGLSAPTLIGHADARLALIPRLELDAAPVRFTRDAVDAAVLRSDLSELLSRAVGAPVHGLLGYSLFKHYRLLFDYPHRVLWLDPLPENWDARPHEYSHVGLQLERGDSSIVVSGVATGSPADERGILPGDELVRVDDRAVSGDRVLDVARRLEGVPGSAVRLTLRRGTIERTYRLVRRRLL